MRPYRYDIVGSFLRPDYLKKARADFEAGTITAEELKKVEAFAFDVDGVFSRHEMNITPEGDLIRTSCTKDGYAMMYCTKKGYPVCIISGGEAPGVRERFEKLGVKDVYLGVANKVEVLNEFLQKHNLNPENVM